MVIVHLELELHSVVCETRGLDESWELGRPATSAPRSIEGRQRWSNFANTAQLKPFQAHF